MKLSGSIFLGFSFGAVGASVQQRIAKARIAVAVVRTVDLLSLGIAAVLLVASCQQPQEQRVNKCDVKTQDAIPAANGRLAMSKETRTMIRDILTKASVVTTSIDIKGRSTRAVALPEELQALYKTHPRALIEELLAIATFGPASDAVKAIAYANALLFGPETAVGLVTYQSNPEQIDIVDNDGFSIRAAYVNGIENALCDMR